MGVVMGDILEWLGWVVVYRKVLALLADVADDNCGLPVKFAMPMVGIES